MSVGGNFFKGDVLVGHIGIGGRMLGFIGRILLVVVT